ncbi:MAG: hypothetical protein ACHQT8_01055 [Chlamydiales bacterium]
MIRLTLVLENCRFRQFFPAEEKAGKTKKEGFFTTESTENAEEEREKENTIGFAGTIAAHRGGTMKKKNSIRTNGVVA